MVRNCCLDISFFLGGGDIAEWGAGGSVYTFFPYSRVSSDRKVTNFSPAMWKPLAWTAFTSELSLKAARTALISSGET